MSDNHEPQPLSRSATEYLEFQDEQQDLSLATSETTVPTSSNGVRPSDSTFLTTSSGRELLDLVDSLRNINNIGNIIPLPEILVVGQQSCGKSSVLNAITGIKFPVNEGLTTQFPTEIILRRTNYHKTTVFFRPSNDPDPAKQLALDKFANEWKSKTVTLHQLPEIIVSARAALGLDGSPRFSDEILVLEVCGPEKENISLTDLPGFFASAGPGQTPEDRNFVERMVDAHMGKRRSILLSVFSCANDFENQILMQKLMDNAKYRERALGIITAPDQIKSEQRAVDYLAYARNQYLHLRHGWHILRNLDARQEAACEPRDKVERDFFETISPWCDFDKSHVGSQALIRRLSSMLEQSIGQALPVLEDEVQKAIENCKSQLKALGDERLTPRQQRKYLRDRGRVFGQALKDTLEGKPRLRELESEEMSLRAWIRYKGGKFYDEMESRGKSWKLVSNHTQGQKQISIAEVFAGSYSDTMELYEADVLSWLSERINQKQGWELPNLVNPHWASRIFQCQSRRWRHLAQAYLNEIFDEVQEYVVKSVATTFDAQASTKILQTIVLPGMRKRKVQLDKKLEEICKPYFDRDIQTLSKRLYKILRIEPSEGGPSSLLDDDQGFISAGKSRLILDTVDAVYDIFNEIFIDNVQNLAVESCLLEGLHKLADADQFEDLEDIDVENLAGEPPENKAKRERLTKQEEQYVKARDEIKIMSSVAAIRLDGVSSSSTGIVSNRQGIQSSAQLEGSKQPTLVEPYQARQREGEGEVEACRVLVSSPLEAASALATSLTAEFAPSTLSQPVRSRANPQTTPQKIRRRRNVSESRDQPGESYDANNDLSSPSTVYSGSSQRDTASSVSSYQGSPQSHMKSSGLSFNALQRKMTETSEEY